MYPAFAELRRRSVHFGRDCGPAVRSEYAPLRRHGRPQSTHAAHRIHPPRGARFQRLRPGRSADCGDRQRHARSARRAAFGDAEGTRQRGCRVGRALQHSQRGGAAVARSHPTDRRGTAARHRTPPPACARSLAGIPPCAAASLGTARRIAHARLTGVRRDAARRHAEHGRDAPCTARHRHAYGKRRRHDLLDRGHVAGGPCARDARSRHRPRALRPRHGRPSARVRA